MPVVSAHRPGSGNLRRASSHGRSSSSSSLSKKGGGGHGAGFTMTSSDHPPRQARKKSLDEASIHSSGRISTHRSETHLARLGGLQRTLSRTTIIDQSPQGSAPNDTSSRGGLKESGNDEDWESNNEDGKEMATDEPAQIDDPPPVAVAEPAPARPPPTPVQKAKGGMFRVHSDDSDLSTSASRSQSFVVPRPTPPAASNGPPPSAPAPEPRNQPSQQPAPTQSNTPESSRSSTAPRSSSASRRHHHSSSTSSIPRANSSSRLISAAALPPAQLQTASVDLSVAPDVAPPPAELAPSPNLPSSARFRPPSLRKASSRSSITSINRPLPRRLQTLSSVGSAAAPPQVSSDQAHGDPGTNQWPQTSSPETESLLSVSHAGRGEHRTENDALGHLRKASFSSFHSTSNGGGRGNFAARAEGGRARTASAASFASVDTLKGSNAGATSAMAALRTQGGGHPRFTTDPGAGHSSSSANGHLRTRLPSSSSSMSLADGLKRAADFVAHPLAALSGPSPSDHYASHSSSSPHLSSSNSHAPSHGWSHLSDPNHSNLVSTFQLEPHGSGRDRSRPWGFGDLMDDHRGLIRTLPIDGKSLIGQSVRRCVALGNGTAIVAGVSGP